MTVHSVNFDMQTLAAGAVAGSITSSVLKDLARTIATVAYAEWVRLAKEKLTGTQADYTNGIQQPVFEDNDSVVALVGALPNAIEDGSAAYDMHDTLLGPNVPVVERGQGRGKHQKKDGGYYRAIPFRHQSAGTVGVLGTPMGNAHSAMLGRLEAQALGKQIHEAAKGLKGTTGGPWKLTINAKGQLSRAFRPVKRGTNWGGRLAAGLAPKLKKEHATDIFAGMVRMQKTYKKATQSYYMTFRTISTDSPGWRRKATPGVKLLPEVAEFAEQQGALILNEFLAGLSGGGAGSAP